MENLVLSKRVEFTIDGDAERVVRFNPNDVHLRARLFELAKVATLKERELNERVAEIEELSGEDEFGLPKEAAATIAVTVEVADFMMTQIDSVFGPGTSLKVFKEGFDFEGCGVFLDFVLSKVEGVSNKKVEARLKKSGSKKVMK